MTARDVVTLGVAVVVAAGVLMLGHLGAGSGRDASAASTPQPKATNDSAPSASAGPGHGVALGGTFDPATLPVRRVDQALVVAQVSGGSNTEGSEPTPASLLVLDAATGDWVWSDLVWKALGPLQLSPDGRSLLRTEWTSSRGLHHEVVDLATGAARPVPMPDTADCMVDSLAWAPDGRHLGLVSVCETEDEISFMVTSATLVEEVDLETGRSRVVERVPSSAPSEAYPSYSPDGLLLAYGIGQVSDADDRVTNTEDQESRGSVRVVPVHGGEAYEWDNLHIVYGDPWRDPTTLLAWDEFNDPTGPGSHALLSTETGARTPYGVDRLTNLDGFVDGTLLAEQTNWLHAPDPCPVTLCSVDLGTGAVAPWLTLPTGMQIGVGSVSAARALLAD